MEGIMLKVNELYDALVQKNKEADAREINLNDRKLAQDNIDESQAAAKADLVEREATVSKIESVVALKNQVDTKFTELGVKQDQFVADKQAHSELVERELKAIAEQKADNKSIKEAFVKEKGDLEGKIKAEIFAKLKKS